VRRRSSSKDLHPGPPRARWTWQEDLRPGPPRRWRRRRWRHCRWRRGGTASRPPRRACWLGTTSIGVQRRVGSMEPRAGRGGKHRVELPQLGEEVGLRRSHSARRPRDAPANGGSRGHERRESAHVANHHSEVLLPGPRAGPRARSSCQVLLAGPRTRSAACARSSSQDLARGAPPPPWWSSQEDLTGGPHQQSCVWAAEFVRALPTETGEFESRSLTQKQQKPSRARPRRAAQAARLRSVVQWSQPESLPRTSSCCALTDLELVPGPRLTRRSWRQDRMDECSAQMVDA